MRLLIVAGVLVAAAGTARASWTVELDGGDRMTVDSYWQEGDRLHLMRDGVDLSVPRSRVRSMVKSDEHLVAPKPSRPSSAPVAASKSSDKPTRDELEAQEAGIEKHLLRVQQERFEAEARGDDPAAVKRLNREFKRTQTRRYDTVKALRDAQ